jgi:hypothetical protein
MLRPLEELQSCNAKPEKSIDLDYSSLPPQLVIFKALKSKHFILAAVCGMALLSNVLAVAFSGLFNQSLTDVRQLHEMRSKFDLKFVNINGSIGPQSNVGFGSMETSGAYQGGNGEDQFLIAESNYTRGTPLPAWTDDKLFYQPFAWPDEKQDSVNASGDVRLEATTKAFGAELECTELELGNDFYARIDVDVDTEDTITDTRVSMNFTVSTDSGDVRCSSQSLTLRTGPVRSKQACVSGPSAAEVMSILEPWVNATQKEKDVCMGSVVVGWLRDAQGTCSPARNLTITRSNSLFVQCKPKLVTGTATIRVDESGRLVQKAENFTLAGTYPVLCCSWPS